MGQDFTIITETAEGLKIVGGGDDSNMSKVWGNLRFPHALITCCKDHSIKFRSKHSTVSLLCLLQI